MNNNKIVKLIEETQLVSNFNAFGDTDKEFIGEVLNLYIDEIPSMSKGLEIAFTKKDLPSLTYYTHKLSGSLLNLGCDCLVDLCRRIQNSIKENNVNTDISYMIIELKESITKLIIELNELSEKYPVSGDNP